MDPPGQPLHRRLSRYFWGFPPFLALVETIALAVHFQDMDMVGEAVQQSPGQAFRAEYWTHPGKVEAPYTVCIASASNLTGLVKSSVECRRTGL